MPLHDKVILVKALWDNDASVSHHVLTGSHNITIDALRNNDELLLRLGRNQVAHDEFAQHIASAWNPAGNDFFGAPRVFGGDWPSEFPLNAAVLGALDGL